jgi:hypothetical protein
MWVELSDANLVLNEGTLKTFLYERIHDGTIQGQIPHDTSYTLEISIYYIDDYKLYWLTPEIDNNAV